jgi:hypothetical protein
MLRVDKRLQSSNIPREPTFPAKQTIEPVNSESSILLMTDIISPWQSL